MGKTAFSGPAYGAKATLFSGVFTASTGAIDTLAGTKVPSGEDWYATEVALFRGSTGSTGLTVSVLDDSTSLATVGVGGSSLTGAAVVTIFTADSGEYEGTRIASGSVVSFSHSSHAGPNANISITLRGFTRFIDSSRVG